jgi:hypothetical protein
MNRALPITINIMLLLFACSLATARAQQPKPPEPATTPAAAAHFDRLAAAKTIYVKNAGGNEIPYNVICRSFETWGRYILLDSPDQADIVMEVLSPSDEKEKKDKDSESSKTSVRSGNQQPEASTPKEPVSDEIKIIVYDKNHRPMWTGREEPKFAMKHKAEEKNLVEAAQRLFVRFHDRVEPPPKP